MHTSACVKIATFHIKRKLLKKLVIICSLVFFLHNGAKGQSNWRQYILPGYSVMDTASGDLNRDGKGDLLLVLKNDQEEASMDTTRPLLILFGEGKGSYKLFARNDSVVMCRGCGGVFGDPYQGLTVKSNFFSVEHYGGSNWRWSRIITFRYDVKTGQLLLHRDAGESFHVENPNKSKPYAYTKEDYGKLPFSNYSYDKIWRNQTE
jgi:hypothetical protein